VRDPCATAFGGKQGSEVGYGAETCLPLVPHIIRVLLQQGLEAGMVAEGLSTNPPAQSGLARRSSTNS